jgi:hypothetical protein
MAAASPTLVIDGVERVVGGAWVGPVSPLKSGEREIRILYLRSYAPSIEDWVEHKVVAKVGKHQSAAVKVPDGFSNALDKAWDKATPTPAPAGAPKAP